MGLFFGDVALPGTQRPDFQMILNTVKYNLLFAQLAQCRQFRRYFVFFPAGQALHAEPGHKKSAERTDILPRGRNMCQAFALAHFEKAASVYKFSEMIGSGSDEQATSGRAIAQRIAGRCPGIPIPVVFRLKRGSRNFR